MFRKMVAVGVLGSTIVCVVPAIEANTDTLDIPANQVLQALADRPMQSPNGGYYIPSTTQTVRWGSLPNRDAEPLLTVPSGSVVTFDTVSHEGVLEDQGRNPVRYFGSKGVAPAAGDFEVSQVVDKTKGVHGLIRKRDFAATSR